MKSTNTLVVLLLLVLAVRPRPAHGQQRVAGGPYESCVAQFYDPEEYSWLAFQNKCGVHIYVTFCWLDGSGCGAADLAPSKKENLGVSRQEVGDKGGYVFMPCPDGYYAVDENGHVFHSLRVRGRYSCSKR
jgi:hypothetical protein